MEMKSSGSPHPSMSILLCPLAEGTLPRSLFGGLSGVDWGCTTGSSLSTLPCGSVQKYTFLQVLIDSDDFGSSWGN